MSRICGSSDTTSCLSPPPSPASFHLDICIVFEQTPSVSGVQASTDHRNILWRTYSLSHGVWLLLLAHQDLSTHTFLFGRLVGQVWCWRMIPHMVARAGVHLAVWRCVAWWGRGRDEMTLLRLILVVVYQNDPEYGYLKQTSQWVFMGFPQTKRVMCLLAWGVWGGEATSDVGRFGCPCKWASEHYRVSAPTPSGTNGVWLGGAFQAAAKSPGQKLLVFLAECNIL